MSRLAEYQNFLAKFRSVNPHLNYRDAQKQASDAFHQSRGTMKTVRASKAPVGKGMSTRSTQRGGVNPIADSDYRPNPRSILDILLDDWSKGNQITTNFLGNEVYADEARYQSEIINL